MLSQEIIRKSAASDAITQRSKHALHDYNAALKTFSWATARLELSSQINDNPNLASYCVDCHVDSGRGRHIAIRWIDKDYKRHDVSYALLKQRSNKFTNVLATLGVAKGDRVFSLLPGIPELYYDGLIISAQNCTDSRLFTNA